MSRKYKHGDRVPTDVLAARLKELGKAVTKGRDEVTRTFVMRIPAELDHCPDLVLSEASRRLTENSKILGDDTPLPARDVMTKLADAAEILLQRHDYDAHGYEQIEACVKQARVLAARSAA